MNKTHNPVFDNADLLAREKDIDQATRALRAIAHPLRLKILCVLGDGEASVQDIIDSVGTSQSNISQHLGTLRDKGVLGSRREANKVYYYMIDSRILRVLEMLQDIFCTPADQKW